MDYRSWDSAYCTEDSRILLLMVWEKPNKESRSNGGQLEAEPEKP